MKKFFLTVLFLLFSVQTSTASLTAADLVNTVRLYRVYWSGIHVADLAAEVHDGGFDAVIESYGIARTISKYSSRTKTRFQFNEGEFVPLSFYTEFNQRHGSRKIDIKYSENGQIIEEAVTPPDNRAKRPAVDNVLKQNTVDPLTAVMIARQKVRNSLQKGEDKFSFNMYDGRRLARLDFQIHERKKRKISGVERDIIKVTFKRHPIEGFTNNELRRMKEEEPVFTLYLSDDEYLLPIKADADAPIGTAVLLYERDCASVESCIEK